MDRNQELEILKIELENMIVGMEICEGLLSQEEKDHLNLHRRSLSILKRIRPEKRADQAAADRVDEELLRAAGVNVSK